MPIPFAAIGLAMSAAQLGAGIYGLTQASKIPPELQEALDLFQQQAREGLPANIE